MSDKPRVWFCIYEAYDEDEKGRPLPGTSSIVGHESDPTGANLSWENPFKVIEYSAVQRLESRIEKLREALNFSLGKFNAVIDCPDLAISRCPMGADLCRKALQADDEAAK